MKFPPIIAWHVITSTPGDVRFDQIARNGFIFPFKMRRYPKRIRRIYYPYLSGSQWAKIQREAYEYYRLPPVRRFREQVTVLKNQIKEIDKLAGDHKYVFLALAPIKTPTAIPELFERMRSHEFLPAYRYAYGFDAIELINRGAIVGLTDLLPFYEHALFELAIKVFSKVIFDIVYGSDVAMLERAVKHATSAASNYSNRVDILVRYIAGYGYKDEIFNALRKVQNEYRFRGEKAKKIVISAWMKCYRSLVDSKGEWTKESKKACGVPTGKFKEIEILWPGPLPVAWAKYVIFAGNLHPAHKVLNMQYMRQKLAYAVNG